MKVLSKRLKEARNKAGYNQLEASKKLGISNGTLSGYERDYRDPDTEILYKMSVLYDVSADWLIGKTEKRNESENQELEELLNDPNTQLMFKNWKGMSEKAREEAIEMIKYIQFKNKGSD